MQIYPPGTRIGQYEIASFPMMGGMGVVYFALDHGNDGRPVALKTFRPELLPDRAARDRFLREGTAWVELGIHPHIVRCYKVEYIDPAAFLVLELIAKEQNMPDASLRSWLIPGHPLPLEQALLFALQIARGMQHAAEKIHGFVHRDLKPENILIGADRLPGTNINRLRVTDFGLAKTIAESITESTMPDGTELKPNQFQFTRGAGTPLYMAPEQWTGRAISIATDIYALGCILYEMLAGQPVAEGRKISELLSSHCSGKLRQLPGAVPQGVAILLTKCISLSPGKRYGNWKELSTALENAYSTHCSRSAPQATVLEASSRDEHIHSGWSYDSIGTAYLNLGKVDIAAGYFEKALTIAREIGDRIGENIALENIGLSYAERGDAQRAIICFEQVLEFYREVGYRSGEGDGLNDLGLAHRQLGDERQAIRCFEQALTIFREIGDQRREGYSLGNLGNSYVNLRYVQQAISYFEQALTIQREVGDRRAEGRESNNLGLAHEKLGDKRRAIGYYEQCRSIAHEIGDAHAEGVASNNLGNAYLELGDPQRAIIYYGQSLDIARETTNRHGEGNALGNIGNAYLTIEDLQQAINCYEQVLTIQREIGDRRLEGIALNNIGEAYRRLGDARRAIGYFEQSLIIGRETMEKDLERQSLVNLGVAYRDLGEMEQALACYEQAGLLKERFEQVKLVPNALGDFISAESLDDVRRVIRQYSFLNNSQFIQTVEQMVQEQDNLESKHKVEQLLVWLKQALGK